MNTEDSDFSRPPYVTCSYHGRRPSAVLCIHLTHSRGRGFYRMGGEVGAEEELFAMCMFCAMLDLQGSGWMDDAMAADNLCTVCDKCFDLAEARNFADDEDDWVNSGLDS